ncbi:MAG: MmgE/PrpD family protein, partial [Betaproteobacteria bacterium]
MDRTTQRLVDYALSYPDRSLTPAARASTVNHLIDTIGVAIAGTTAVPARIAARRAVASRAEPGCTVIGHGSGSAPDMAAFANAVMVRTYDWN